MSFYDQFLSTIGPGYQEGFADLLAIVRDAPRETFFSGMASSIRSQDIIAASSFDLNFSQESANKTRYAGEGADPNSIFIQGAKVRSAFGMPMYVPYIGWIDPAFALLWDYTRLSYCGTASTALGGLIAPMGFTTTVPSGVSSLITDNIADFLSISCPFTLTIIGPVDGSELSENVTITSVNKSTRTLNLQNPTTHLHTIAITSIVARITTEDGPEREPGWSLFSLREGMMSPCLVDKLTINAEIGTPIQITGELAALNLFRDRQVDLRSYRDAILSAWAKKPIGRVADSLSASITTTSAQSGNFGLSSSLGHPLFTGFQGLNLPSVIVTGISITISNNLQEVYTAHSRKTGRSRQQENSFPFALASEGRSIEGTIKYRSSLDPWAVAERLSGPSALADGGLKVNYGSCMITIPELAWAPSASESKVDGEQNRTLNWSMVAEGYDDMPRLEYNDQS